MSHRFLPALTFCPLAAVFGLGLLAILFLAPAASAHGLPSGLGKSPSGEEDVSPRAARAARPSYVIGGARWPGRTIRYYNATPRGKYRTAVAYAAREWNMRGLGVKLVAVKSARRAQVIVSRDRRINPGGLATLGYTRGYQGWVKLNMDSYSWHDIAWVASHEFGHTFGLGHSRGCTVMSYSAYNDCKWPVNAYQWRCRVQERMDLAGVRKLYGGRAQARPLPFCLKSPAAAKVANLSAIAGDRSRIATLSWSAAARARSYVVARSESSGACPTTLASGWTITTTTYADTGDPFAGLTSGRYCYSVWSLNKDGAPTGPTYIYVDYAPPLPGPVTGLSAALNPGDGSTISATVDLTWVAPSGTSAILVKRSLANGPCITSSEDQTGTSLYADIAFAQDYVYELTNGATYCYSVFAADDNSGLWSVPATVSVTVS